MNLYNKETHPENKETILFIHGYNMAGWMWDEQVKAFSDYHCLVPDLPEHGNSSDVEPFTIDGAAQILIDFVLDKAQLQRSQITH